MRYNRLIIISTLLVLLVGLTAVQPGLAAEGVINDNGVNVRSGPGTNFSILNTLTKETAITVLETKGDWRQIQFGTMKGWVSARYIIAGNANSTTSYRLRVTGDLVNLRSGPDTGYDKVGQVHKGDILNVIDTEGNWYHVRTSGNLDGYILSEYVEKAGASSPDAPSASNPASVSYVKVIEGPANIRSAADSNSAKVASLEQNTICPVLESEGDWYKIRLASGKTGYVASWLVQATQAAPTTNSSGPLTSGTTAEKAVVVVLDGKPLSFDVSPIIENNRTLVPLRAIFEAMGAGVYWDGGSKTVYAHRKGITVILPIGSTSPTVNRNIKKLDVPAQIVKERTLVPLRFVAEAFGGQVGWNDKTRTITIASPPADNKVPVSVTPSDQAVNLRNQPTPSADKIDTAPAGETLKVLAERNGWYQVSRGGVSGWVAGWLVQVAWEENESDADQGDDQTPASAGNTNTSSSPIVSPDVIHLSRVRIEGGIKICIDSGAVLKGEIKEDDDQVRYEFTGRRLEGLNYFEEKIGSELLKVRGRNDDNKAVIEVMFPDGTQYATSSELGGNREVLTIQNYIRSIEQGSFGSNGQRILINTIDKLKYSHRRDGDRIIVQIQNLLPGKVDEKYTYDSDLVESLEVGKTPGDEAGVTLTINTKDVSKYALGVTGDGNVLNIMLADKDAEKSRKENLVVLDPGHGGTDTGAKREDINEKDINLSIALKAGELLKQSGIEVEYTRSTDTTVGLDERCEIANKLNAGLFVSIHNNANNDNSKQGTETYYYAPADNPDLFIQQEERQALAKDLQEGLVKALGRPDRGTKTANFAVLRGTTMPSVLAECVFLSNSDERQMICQEYYQKQAAQAITEAVLKYMHK